MRRLFLWATVLVSLILTAGCGGGIADGGRDRQERWKRVFENDSKQFNDDVDAALLMDRPGHLSWWQVE
ncbi:MAG TPA: hypothetical protein VLM89_04540 [Phycisphaerae bacterium]|nr:hypothetical protein [Phycisphaerae bacterium]